MTLFLAGLAGGVANAVAGGGSLVTLPALLDAGLPPLVANGTNRPFVVAQSASAAWALARAAPDTAATTAIATLRVPVGVGALAGAIVSLWMPAAWFRVALGVVLVAIGVTLIADPTRFVPDPPPPPAPSSRQRSLAVAIGAYGGWLQAGLGLPLTWMLGVPCGLAPRAASHAKSALSVAINFPAILVFGLTGAIHVEHAAPLAIGGVVGGLIGARIVAAGGAAVIRAGLIVAAIVNGYRLLFPGST